MSGEDRMEVEEAVKHTLYTLVNSAKKHLEETYKDPLDERIDGMLREF